MIAESSGRRRGPVAFPARAARVLVTAALAAVAAVAATVPTATATSRAAAVEGGGRCREVSFPVALTASGPISERVAGSLCLPRRLSSDALQVLVSGIPFDRAYWDFPVQPGRYSYVRRATEAGIATLVLDRLGTGRSSRAAAEAITLDSQTLALQQVVRAVRDHSPTPGLHRVVTVGFSVGSAIVLQHAGRYGGVDGVVLTGFAHSVGPAISRFGTVVVQASADPVTAAGNPPAGYLTVTRAAQDLFGFNPATSSSRIRDAADARKSTFAAAEGDGFARVIADTALSRSVQVPVLAVIGADDRLFCTPGCPEAAAEQAAYAPQAQLQVSLIPATAHNLNLHVSAPASQNTILSWHSVHFSADPSEHES